MPQIRRFRTKCAFMGLIFLLALFPPFKARAEEGADLDVMARQYEEALEINSEDNNIKRQLSIIYHNQALKLADTGMFLDAVSKEKKALELAPDEPIVKKTMAYFYNAYALELKDKDNLYEAIDYLKLAVNCGSDEPQLKKNIAVVYIEIAYKQFEKAEYPESERALQEAEYFDTENPYLYALKGEIASSRDDYYQVEKNWTRALELDPNLYDVRLKLEKVKKEKDIEKNYNIHEVENFKLKFEGLEKENLADSAAEILRDAYREIGQDFNLYPQTVIPVIIYPAQALKKLEYFPDWAAGTYDGKIRFGEDLGKEDWHMKAVLYHEYTHVLVHLLGQNAVPLWLNEGLAEYQARRFKTEKLLNEQKKILLKEAKKGTLFAIDALSAMDLTKLSYLSSHRIELVYVQSESFVTYIINRASLYDVKNLLIRLKQGVNLYKAVKDVLFVDLEVLERGWKNELSPE